MSQRQAPPPEHDFGQEDEPPEVVLAVLASINLLNDIEQFLRTSRGDAPDLRLRITAVTSVLRRVHQNWSRTDDSK
jgi:hypothetical protein